MYKNASKDKLLVALLMLFGCTGKTVYRFEVEGDIDTGHCIGYDKDGHDIFKVPITDTIVIRTSMTRQHMSTE